MGEDRENGPGGEGADSPSEAVVLHAGYLGIFAMAWAACMAISGILVLTLPTHWWATGFLALAFVWAATFLWKDFRASREVRRNGCGGSCIPLGMLAAILSAFLFVLSLPRPAAGATPDDIGFAATPIGRR